MVVDDRLMGWPDIGGEGRGGDIVMGGDTDWKSCRLKERGDRGDRKGGGGRVVPTQCGRCRRACIGIDAWRVRENWHRCRGVVTEAGDNCLGWARLWNIREMSPEMNGLGLLCGLWG